MRNSRRNRHGADETAEMPEPAADGDSAADPAEDLASERAARSAADAVTGEDSGGAAAGLDTGTDSADGAGAEREKYLRLAAEYDNFRKRTAKERIEAGARAQAEMVRRIVEGLDDLSRFAHVDPSTTDAATVVEGVEMVEKKILRELTSLGLEVVNPVDQAFDPALHEAVATEPTPAKEDDHVVARVYQPGYVFQGQLLRPARVVVKQWTG